MNPIQNRLFKGAVFCFNNETENLRNWIVTMPASGMTFT